jgi:hypothetical protein
MPTLTSRLARSPASTARHDTGGGKDDPFASAEAVDSKAEMPTAEQVWARVRAVHLSSAGLLAGAAVVAAVAAGALLSIRTELSAFVFALTCAVVLGLCGRRVRTWPERAAVAVPALALILAACALAQTGAEPLRLTAVGVLLTLTALATLAGLIDRRRRWVAITAARLEYVTVAAVVPLALWPLGIYDRLGLW